MPADALSRVFSALADPTRRDMVARLAVADATVNELAEPYDVSVQAVSKHLRVLEDAGLVSRTREAQRRPVHLEAEVFDLMTKWIERYRQQAEERYRRLDDVLRAMPDDVDTDPPQTGESHDHDHHHPRHRDHRRPGRAARAHRPRVRRTAGEGVPGPHRPRAARRSGSARDGLDDGGRPRSTAAPAASTATCTRRDGEEYGFHGCFHDVRPNELIVQTFTFEGVPDSVALEKLTLEDLGDGRTRLVVTSLVDSFEDRDAMVASGMETGIVEGYEKLDDLLADADSVLHHLGFVGGVVVRIELPAPAAVLEDVLLGLRQDRAGSVDLVLPDGDVLADAGAEGVGRLLDRCLTVLLRAVNTHRTRTFSSSIGVVEDRNVTQPSTRSTPSPRP